MEIEYNELIKENNEIDIKNEKEYKFYLYKELMEKCREIVYSTSKEEVLNELPHIIEVLNLIAEFENTSLENILEETNVIKKRRLFKINKKGE